MPIPLYGFLQGDTLGVLIFAEGDDTLKVLARKLQDEASLRVARKEVVHLVYKDQIMDSMMTVAEAGLQPLDRFDVVSG